ncbi:MAG: hypothetical protein H0W69_03920 [Gemmatimonadaceae bacterium]|nr:hypothetical protein [Gemmatimonadaceae bacterium]
MTIIKRMRGFLFAFASLFPLGACVHRTRETQLPHVQWLTISVALMEKEVYERVAPADADRLGCKGVAENLPICSVGLPSPDEDLHFALKWRAWHRIQMCTAGIFRRQ